VHQQSLRDRRPCNRRPGHNRRNVRRDSGSRYNSGIDYVGTDACADYRGGSDDSCAGQHCSLWHDNRSGYHHSTYHGCTLDHDSANHGSADHHGSTHYSGTEHSSTDRHGGTDHVGTDHSSANHHGGTDHVGTDHASADYHDLTNLGVSVKECLDTHLSMCMSAQYRERLNSFHRST